MKQVTEKYIKKLLELAKEVDKLNEPDKTWKFQEALNRLLGYISALEESQ